VSDDFTFLSTLPGTTSALKCSEGPGLSRFDGKCSVGIRTDFRLQILLLSLCIPIGNRSSLIILSYWAKYNEALTKITDKGKCPGVIIAQGCGHFIQKDNPKFVASEVGSMIWKLEW
jgi:hypothetical protein